MIVTAIFHFFENATTLCQFFHDTQEECDNGEFYDQMNANQINHTIDLSFLMLSLITMKVSLLYCHYFQNIPFESKVS